jgi:hypothetical protein
MIQAPGPILPERVGPEGAYVKDVDRAHVGRRLAELARDERWYARALALDLAARWAAPGSEHGIALFEILAREPDDRARAVAVRSVARELWSLRKTLTADPAVRAAYLDMLERAGDDDARADLAEIRRMLRPRKR